MRGFYSQGKSGGKGEFEESQGRSGKNRDYRFYMNFEWNGQSFTFEVF